MVFDAGKTGGISTEIALGLNELFAPLFERAILEMWDAKWSGEYKPLDMAGSIEIRVNYVNGTIDLVTLDFGGIDVLLALGDTEKTGRRVDIIAYLWPGRDDTTYRYVCFVWAGGLTV